MWNIRINGNIDIEPFHLFIHVNSFLRSVKLKRLALGR